MHITGDPVTPYVICVLADLATTITFALAFYKHIRPWNILVGATCFIFYAIAFALIGISAGPNPPFRRIEAAEIIRDSFVTGALIRFAWLLLIISEVTKIDWQWRRK